MARIEDYTSLQTAIGEEANRTDVPADLMIQLAESKLMADARVRDLTAPTSFTITADGDALPADFAAVDAWYYDGAARVGDIEVVMDLGNVKRQLGLTTAGVPRFVAIRDGKAYYAPTPSGSFTTTLSYTRKLTPLGVNGTTTNWLLDEFPLVYLAASMVETARWMKDKELRMEWEEALDKELSKMRSAMWEAPAGGGRVRRFHRPIG